MELRASAPLFKRIIFQIPTPLRTNFSLEAQKQLQCRPPLCRALYTHVKKTGIAGFDKNREIFERKNQGKSLPSWLENSRCVNQEEVEELYDAFAPFVEDLTNLSCTNNLPQGNQRLSDMTEHIVPWAPIHAAQVIATDRFYVERAKRKNEKIENEENHRLLVHKLAWALEMIARNAYVTDDVIDGNDERNGYVCWHTLPNIGLESINDFGSLITGGFLVLDRYFRNKEYYSELIKFIFEKMHQTIVSTNQLHAMISTSIGAGYDCLHHNGQRHVSSFSFEEMLAVKSIQNSSILLELPVIGTMMLHGIKDPELIKQAREIGLKVMESAMMVDDWIDCFGTVEVTERETSDIQKGRQTWLIWKAMDLGSQEQCQRLAECYGKNDAKCVEEVKQIYRQLNIKEVVSKMVEDNAKATEVEISKLPPDDLPCSVWVNMFNHYRDVMAGKAARP